MLLALIVLIQYYLRHIDLVVEFLLSANLEHYDVGGEPDNPILASEGICGILVAIAHDIVLHLLQFLAFFAVFSSSFLVCAGRC